MSDWHRAGVLAIMVLSACSSAPKLSDDGRRVRDVNTFVAELGRAYGREESTAFMAGVAAQFPERDALQRAAEAAFARFDRIELALMIERVHLEGTTATVYLHWDAQWRVSANAPIVRQGMARFVIETADRPVLTAVLGDDPFTTIPAAQP